MSLRNVLAMGAAALFVVASSAALADGDVKKGAKVFKKCKACHTIKQGGKHRVGPNLHGVIGRKAGTAEGFKKFSKGLKAAGFAWDEKMLDEYLTSPKKMIKGSRMAFPGLKKAKDRANVIAYLMKETM